MEDYKLGKYLIKNVPMEYSGKAKEFIRSNETELSVAKLLDYMDKYELHTYDYTEWEEINR